MRGHRHGLRGGPGTAASRRVHSASMALLGLSVVIVCLVMVNVIARRFPARLDVTATGDHRLAPRTQSLLETLDGSYVVALAGDFSSVERGPMERVRDVLGQMQRVSPRLGVRFLDTSSPAGQQEFVGLIGELAGRERDVLDLQSRSIRAAADRGLTTAEYLESGLAPAISSIRDLLPMDASSLRIREALDARSAACRLSAADLRVAARSIDEPLSATIAGISIPRTDTAGSEVRAVLTQVGEQVSTLVRDLRAIAAAEGLAERSRGGASGLIEPAEKARDAALSAADSISRLSRPDVIRVAGALAEGNACLVIGPPGTGLIAIEFSQLFPPALRFESAADAGRRAESLVSTAIGAINTPYRPIVVFMHGELGSGLIEQKGIVTRLVERLSLRGIDAVEWPVVRQADPPSLASLNPDGRRPVVYVTIPPDSSSPKPRPTDPSGSERAVTFGQALDRVAQRGASILLSMYPSVLPSYGDPDPTTSVLAGFGLSADSSRPVMRDRLTPQGRVVETEQALRASAGDHPIQGAIRGLPTMFLWPIAITGWAGSGLGSGLGSGADSGVSTVAGSGTGSGARTTVLFEVPAETQSWRESQWLNYWRMPRPERALIPNPPVFDASRDAREYPMVVGVASEIPPSGGLDRRRLVAIGSNRWFMDPVTVPTVTIDGRTLSANPGNIELFESAVYWLADQDELIAPSPEARAVAMVQTVSPEAVWWIRAGAVAFLPVLVLLTGALHRLVRG